MNITEILNPCIIDLTFKSPGETVLNTEYFTIHWYGVIIALAFLSGLKAALYIAKQEDIDPDRIINLSALLLICGVIFSRLYYVIFSWDYFSKNLAEIFMIWHGGLSIHGIIIGCFFFLLAYTKIKNLNFFRYTDLFACVLPLGQAIGRWGNFFNSEAFGMPTTLPLRVYIPPEYRPEQFINYEYFHPTFFYESVWNFTVFFILFFLIRPKYKQTSGVITLSYLILYSTGRFFIEAFRTDNIYTVFSLHIAQFVSLILIIISVAGLFAIFWKGKSFLKDMYRNK